MVTTSHKHSAEFEVERWQAAVAVESDGIWNEVRWVSFQGCDTESRNEDERKFFELNVSN